MSLASIRSTISWLLMAPPTWAIVAGIVTKTTQIAIGSFFRAPQRWASLMSRIAQVPGGQIVISFCPAILVGLAAGVTLELYNRSRLFIIATPSDGLIDYTPEYDSIDKHIEAEFRKGPNSRSEIKQSEQGECTAFICSNYPKIQTDAHNIFCDAYRYAATNQVQFIALADGCGISNSSQRAARAVVDGFFEHLISKHAGASASKLVMDAVQHAQKEIEKKHDGTDPNKSYGGTTFLGGVIYMTANGKRYFTGVNCGDCKLYHIQNGQVIERTEAARIEAGDSGGRFGPNRKEKDKTEKIISFEVQPGEKLLFMTDGVHDNLDRNPVEKGMKQELGEADIRKLSTLQRFPDDPEIGLHIMQNIVQHTDKYHTELVRRLSLPRPETMKNASHVEFPGKPDHMTLLVIQVK